jgi:CBS domain-containing protein
MRVKEAMTAGLETISPDATLEQAARKMYAHNVGLLPVVEGKAIAGVVTDRDIIVRVSPTAITRVGRTCARS